MAYVTTSELRQDMATAINRVAFGHERIVLRRNKKDIVAIVSVEDLALLEELENHLDVEAYRKAKTQHGKDGKKTVSFEKVCREMGL